MARPIITLTTDFGTGDYFVGAMKGVILSINPDVTIVDITHNVLPHDVLDGALTIGNAYKYFPPKTIHVVVVDPGVGTTRRPLLVAGDQHYFIGPDNGVFSSVYDQTEALHVWNVISEHYFRQPVSNTFHGRDIFAPVAAWLTKSWQTSAFGEVITDFVRFGLPKPKVNGNIVKGVVLRVDHFGNLITNLTPADVPALAEAEGKFTIKAGNGQITKMVPTFSQAAPGEAVGVIGSTGHIEIAVNKGSASKALGAARGAEVTVELG
ncbi:MAG TPA: SAM-dependent chlorinase/fluorinase [Candidatus Dormibacteraeota bacterium]|nr:SAM-dependent chlorinase/fluorinase [Candidatus Dormibacteraeota bacterium]